MQIRFFASMFLNLPHRAGRHYKSLLEQNKKDIFIDNHSLYPYFVSAFHKLPLDRRIQEL